MLPFRDFLVFFFTFPNYNLENAGDFIQLTINLVLENWEGAALKQLFSQ